MNNIISFSFLIAIAIIALLFNQLSIYFFKLNAYELYSFAWNSGKIGWGISISLILFLFAYGVLFNLNIVKSYALWSGQTVRYVPLGKDLANGEYYYEHDDPSRKVILSGGNEIDQSAWFYESLGNLKAETVVRYGTKPNQVYSIESFKSQFIILSFLVELFFLGVVLVLMLTVVGACLESTVSGVEPFRGDTVFVTALKWFRIEHAGFLSKLMICIFGLYTFWILLTFIPANKLRTSSEKEQVVQILPPSIVDGAKLPGVFEKYDIYSSTTTSTNSSRSVGRFTNRHINALVRFDNVYDVPVYIRFSLHDLDKNWKWFEDHKSRKGDEMEFKLIDGLRIWPVGLEEDPDE